LLLRDLKIHRTPKTPQVDFNQTTGVFLLAGVSVPENSMEFYGKLIKWLKEYAKQPAKKTKIIFKLSYVNTSSLQFIYDLLMLLDAVNNDISNVSVEWYYLEEDTDMKEMGEDFKEAVNVDFSFFAVEAVE
jgi:alpha-amylase/alpha-mannosidase (GH57 family)